MNVRLSYLILLLLFTCQSVSAADTKTWLDKLDKSLDRREHFNRIHVDRIEHLRQNMDKARQNGREYEQLYALFNEYKAYCYDSARYYASACLENATRRMRIVPCSPCLSISGFIGIRIYILYPASAHSS